MRSTLVEDHFEPRIPAPTAQAARGCHRQAFVVHHHALRERRQQGRVWQPVNLHVIGLGLARGRIGDPRCPGRVVREQQQALTGLVEAAYRRKPGKA